MNKVSYLSFLLSLSLCACATANEPPPPGSDYSKAGTDGPYLFYKGGKIVAKSVAMEDFLAVARKAVYNKRNEVLVTWNVPETGDAFFFSLMDSITLAQESYPDIPERMLVLSDIEGNFLGLKTMLIGAKVMDDRFNWTYGKGHLVLLGDFFDRGTQVTECLWLIYKLEKEAREVGGVVHFILGNHEVMNLEGDIRYVRNKYMENAELMNEDYTELYGANTELGLWLRSKNAMEHIGKWIFCHAGISPAVTNSRLDLSTVNRLARRWYGKPNKSINDPDAALIFDGKTGIFWYREMARNKAQDTDVAAALEKFGAERLIVGHTLVSEVKSYYKGKLVCIDLYHEENIRQGFMQTLLIQKGLFYALNSSGEKSAIKVE